MTELLCYNKGCAKNFKLDENNEESCQFHPGVPVFHDALKGWSCCKRRTTDFSDFLNIPGCTKGLHSNVKPEPIKPEVKTSKPKLPKSDNDIITHPTTKPLQYKPIERPSYNEPLTPLRIKTTPTLKQALERLKINSEEDKEVTAGQICKHSGCGQSYQGEHSNNEDCVYHPGGPVFHEGMKYWSCCQRKTSDFSTFLAQAGCSTGKHEWKSSGPVFTTCRYDWHQTGQVVAISIYAKASNPEKCKFMANQVAIDVAINFLDGNEFKLNLELCGVIRLEKSFVTMSGTKVEITLHKAEPVRWKKLYIVRESKEVKNEEEVSDEPPPLIKEDEDDDLDGIEDTEFD